jgi:hypothetical protein
MSLTEMLDGFAGHEHAYEIFPLYKDVALLEAASGITYTPTLLVAYGGPENKHYMFDTESPHADPKLRRFSYSPDLDGRTRAGSWNPPDEYIFKGVSGSAATIVAHGGHVGLGSHGELQGLGAHWELYLLASGGMPVIDVLRSATLSGAESIGLSKDVGSLEVGKLADLQVLDANPLDNIRNITKMTFVMLNGRLYDAETLDEVWPRKRKLDHQWWWDWDPPPTTARAQ